MATLQNPSNVSDMKVCFVTTGATAPFTGLIESVLQPSSIDALNAEGYTHLLIQYGSAKQIMKQNAQEARERIQGLSGTNLIIDGFDFNQEGLKEQFKMVQQSNGLVISHAGSGSILEALRFQIPLIVVPNTQLLDNHQEDLAVAMERSHYLLRGDVNNLASAIQKSEQFRHQMAQFPPITSGKHRETKSFATIMDETMVPLQLAVSLGHSYASKPNAAQRPSGPPIPQQTPQHAQPYELVFDAEADDPPIYVNAKQFTRILNRRVARTELEVALRESRP